MIKCSKCGRATSDISYDPAWVLLGLIGLAVMAAFGFYLGLETGLCCTSLGIVFLFIAIGFTVPPPANAGLCNECEEARRKTLLEDLRITEPEAAIILESRLRTHPELPVSEELVKDVRQAGKFVLASNYEKAAKMLEKLEMWEQAGEIRGRKNKKTVKVDLNQLLCQLKDGTVLSLKCPTCNAPLIIERRDTKERLSHCSYCGSSIDPFFIEETVKRALR